MHTPWAECEGAAPNRGQDRADGADVLVRLTPAVAGWTLPPRMSPMSPQPLGTRAEDPPPVRGNESTSNLLLGQGTGAGEGDGCPGGPRNAYRGDGVVSRRCVCMEGEESRERRLALGLEMGLG